MQLKYRLNRRSNRTNGTFSAQSCDTGAREIMGTNNRAETGKLTPSKQIGNSDFKEQPISEGDLGIKHSNGLGRTQAVLLQTEFALGNSQQRAS